MTLPVKPRSDADIHRARALARVLDTAVGVPGTKLRVGLDALLGLFPVAGDVVGAVLSGYIVLTAWRRGASAAVIGRMLANIGVDTALGSIPVIGDLFDVGFKSNVRNVKLLEEHAIAPAEVQRRSVRMAVVAVVVILAIVVGLGTLSVFLAEALWHLLKS